MQANPTILQMKYARIVKLFAEQAGLSYEEALGKFYDSTTYDLISNGVADMHCFSDEYLADELLIELGYKQRKWHISSLSETLTYKINNVLAKLDR